MLDDERAVVVVVVVVVRLAMPPPGKFANPVGTAVVAGVAVVLGAAVVALGAAVVLDEEVEAELTVSSKVPEVKVTIPSAITTSFAVRRGEDPTLYAGLSAVIRAIAQCPWRPYSRSRRP